ncbi:proline--tRNA ligase [Thermogemmata fonticola]|uniref:Proline--tRNA ligase n=1 Tax=Thermogemmata fonticola TaxID=2755323 RepID=A0A7V8VFD8_9BACT|nr:proline--tRNA ligase [Thermogemmata fonticola]MBA2227023.1 proline--tRNA ligase [Thermogemmata fonticola]
MAEVITPRAQDYPQWYLDVVKQAGLADNSDVRGCMVIKPNGYAIWEKMQRGLDRLFKETGHVNAYFPLFIPLSYLAREEEMAEGFAKECAVVTHYRLKAEKGGRLEVDPEARLEEPLVVRPTSETIIWHTYKKWIQSYRDLPLLINQWANVVRWEMRTRLFLRTAEFLWQEGHTAHATQKEAEEEAHRMVRVYQKFAEEYMAMPVLVGPKTEGQKFPGAVYTLCIEAMMQDGKALQAGTSHFLGQNFAKAFDVTFTNEQNQQEYAWATSWGVSTRLIGGLIMTHSDDQGLVVPPRLAPIHVVICPLGRNEEERRPCREAAERLARALRDRPRDEFYGYEPLAVHIDTMYDKQIGYRAAEYEVRGVPVRVEIGPKDIEKGACVLARRDRPGKEGKQMGVPLEGAADQIDHLLRDIQKSLYERAKQYRDARTVTARSLDEFRDLFPLRSGDSEELPWNALKFVYAHWDGTRETEEWVQKEFKATIRCLPFDGPQEPGRCIFTGKPSARPVVFARAY